jgi:arylsulfatase A-like enzyme
MLAEILNSRGYNTEAYVSNDTLYGGFGFDRGFDRYIEYSDFPLTKQIEDSSLVRLLKKLYGHAFPYLNIKSVDTTTWVTRNVIKRLEKEREKPLFLWAHYLDPHSPLLPPHEYIDLSDEDTEKALAFTEIHSAAFLDFEETHIDELQALYEAEVRYVDDKIGDIVSVLEEEGYFDNSIIIITSDHGEAFFEHGHYGHGLTHYKEEIDIPLFIYVPDNEPGEVDSPVSLIDIMPTVFDYMAVNDAPEMSGKSLLPLISGETPKEDRLLFIDRTESDNNVRSVRNGRYTLMRRGENEYTYTMIDNSIEKGPDDIIEEPDSGLYNRFQTSLDNYVVDTATEREELGKAETEVGIDKERRDAIKGLGYL